MHRFLIFIGPILTGPVVYTVTYSLYFVAPLSRDNSFCFRLLISKFSKNVVDKHRS